MSPFKQTAHMGKTAVMDSEVEELRVSNEAFEDHVELQRRLAEEGYVFFKGLIKREKLLNLRQEIMQVLMEGGWLVKGTDPMLGIADIDAQCTEGDIEYSEVYHRMYCLQEFHRSGHWPEILDIMEKVIGGEVLPHPQKIARIWFPQYTEHTTPMHQDFVHFQGSFETYTLWAPVGDCPIELGGLAVLPGSHKIGAVREHHFSLGAGNLAVDEEHLSGTWLSTDYAAGDALIFPSLTVHQALPNYTEDRLRVSLDNRYQARNLPIAQHMLEPHMQATSGLTWEKCYAQWQSDELQYYWKKMDLDIVPISTEWGDKGFAEALKLARVGDERAFLQLRRIIRLDPESERGQQAAQLLEEVEPSKP